MKTMSNPHDMWYASTAYNSEEACTFWHLFVNKWCYKNNK